MISPQSRRLRLSGNKLPEYKHEKVELRKRFGLFLQRFDIVETQKDLR